MLKKITRLLPFLIMTLLCIGGVELFYKVAENYLLPPEKETVGDPVVATQTNVSQGQPQKHQDYGVIVERNLFKSFFEEEVPVKEENDNPLEGLENTSLDLVLMGTITGQSGRSRAIILEKAKRKQEIYYKGDYVQDAEIKDIFRGKVILSYQGKDEVLDMSEASSMRPKQTEKPAASPIKQRRRVVSRPPSQPKKRVMAPPAQAGDEAFEDTNVPDQASDDEVSQEEGDAEDSDEATEGEAEQPGNPDESGNDTTTLYRLPVFKLSDRFYGYS